MQFDKTVSVGVDDSGAALVDRMATFVTEISVGERYENERYFYKNRVFDGGSFPFFFAPEGSLWRRKWFPL